MAPSEDLTIKEQKLFLAGIAAGIVGGVFPNLFVAFIMKILDIQAQPTWAIVVEFFIVMAGFLGTVLLLYRAIDNIGKQKQS